MSSPVRHGPATAASVAPVVGISVIALVVPTSVHLGSLLIAAPILVAALSTARWTGGAAALSLLAAMICDIRDGLLHSAVMPVHAAALLAVSVFLVATCRARERVRKEAGQLRAISEATQHVVLRPLPRRIANLRVATAYRAAESLARVGGDLYAAARTPYGTRLIIGDVKGKGLRRSTMRRRCSEPSVRRPTSTPRFRTWPRHSNAACAAMSQRRPTPTPMPRNASSPRCWWSFPATGPS